jgi:hypothetical protein
MTRLPKEITITMPTDGLGDYRVRVIKCIRELTSMDLRQAKAVTETLDPMRLRVNTQVYDSEQGVYVRKDEAYPGLIEQLRLLGVQVEEHGWVDSQPDLWLEVKSLAVRAIEHEDYYLARCLTELLQRQIS